LDPLSQGVLGASATQSITRGREHTTAGVLGLLSAMTPDLDVFIRSSTDPLLFFEYHRQFTHSLIFIPIGGLICAVILHYAYARRRRCSFQKTLLFCTLGYATHALLDACTNYGTQLLWPFSNERFAWNAVSIIDPGFTVPIVILLILSGVIKSPVIARLAFVWALLYPSIGLLQRDRAAAMAAELASGRGHTPIRIEAIPTFANLLVWKVIYETEERFYVDAVRVGLRSEAFPGDAAEKLQIDRDLPWLEPNHQQARDIQRFRWFAGGLIAKDPNRDNVVIDIRYSMIPNEVRPLWAIKLNPHADPREYVEFINDSDARPGRMALFGKMVFGD